MPHRVGRVLTGLLRAGWQLLRGAFRGWWGTGSYVRLYRAVGLQELTDLTSSGSFRPGPPSYQGKWFAETFSHARAWGDLLGRSGGEPFTVVEVEVPVDVAARMFRLANLDRIGPARFADRELLDLLNQSMRGLKPVP